MRGEEAPLRGIKGGLLNGIRGGLAPERLLVGGFGAPGIGSGSFGFLRAFPCRPTAVLGSGIDLACCGRALGGQEARGFGTRGGEPLLDGVLLAPGGGAGLAFDGGLTGAAADFGGGCALG